MTWPTAHVLDTARFVLEPLSVEHTDEMVHVLASPELYTFTGGEPPTSDELRALYERQSRGTSPEGDAGWLNWIIRSRHTRRALGFVQATITRDDEALKTDIAWLVEPAAQNMGVASESAGAVYAWLVSQRVSLVWAYIRPDNEASARVARRLGLEPTLTMVEGETIWAGIPAQPGSPQ